MSGRPRKKVGAACVPAAVTIDAMRPSQPRRSRGVGCQRTHERSLPGPLAEHATWPLTASLHTRTPQQEVTQLYVV